MDYETAYNGTAQTAQKQETAAPAQKYREIPAHALKEKRCSRGSRRPNAVSPAGAAAYGFLKMRFLPHYAAQDAQHCIEEQRLFLSLFSDLCRHYRIETPDTSQLAYPYGREVALHEARRLLQHKYLFHTSIEWEEENGKYSLNAVETFDTCNTLFYIPVLPLHQMMQDRKHSKAARLLLCIFSYLYKTAGVPYYMDEGSYLYWNYEMLCQWVTDDPEGWGEDFNTLCSQVNTALHAGGQMLRRLRSKAHEKHFGKWLSDFTPHNALDAQCYCLARQFFELRKDFPLAHIYRSADTQCLSDLEQYGDTDCITMEKYIGFVCSAQGWLYTQLEQAVNSDFNECSSIQEPVLRRSFDGAEQQADSLDYECRLFPLINELCTLLNNMKL